MRLSKKQRAEVVELLRCAADQRDTARPYIFQVAEDLGHLGTRIGTTCGNAYCAYERFAWPLKDRGVKVDYHDACLEAAALVEEGSWP